MSTVWCFSKIFFHKWKELWLLVINMVYTSSFTSCQTTLDLGSEEIMKYYENLKPSRNYSLVSSLHPKMKLLSIKGKTVLKLKLNFYRSAVFHTNTKVYVIYFGKNCLWKQYFASDSPQFYWNMICFTILLTLRPLR